MLQVTFPLITHPTVLKATSYMACVQPHSLCFSSVLYLRAPQKDPYQTLWGGLLNIIMKKVLKSHLFFSFLPYIRICTSEHLTSGHLTSGHLANLFTGPLTITILFKNRNVL